MIAIHLLALMASFLNALPFLLQWATAVFVLTNWLIADRSFATETRKIKYSEKRGWEIAWGDEFEAVEILGSSVLSTYFIFLHLQNKPPVLIAHDVLDDNTYRQLTVKLKMTVHPS